MTKKRKSDAAAELNACGQRLMNEFREYVRECTPPPIASTTIRTADLQRHFVFEAWAIQKIANLQVLVMALTMRLNEFDIDNTDMSGIMREAARLMAAGNQARE